MGTGLDMAQIKMCIDCMKLLRPVIKPMMKEIIKRVKQTKVRGK